MQRIQTTLALAAAAVASPAALAAQEEGRVAVMTAFEPEWVALRDDLQETEERVLNGTRFVTGTLEGQDVVLFMSGVSMVNAAMTTQLALDHFEISAIVFSGIAGGVDPDLDIGDVTVPDRWGQYLEAIFARETEDGFAIPPWMRSDFANHGMIFTRSVEVRSDRDASPEEKFWFDVDAELMEAAERAAETVTLEDCTAPEECLSEAPQIVTGGSGVSGAAFVDNAAFRRHVFDTFDARVLDMESAGVAHVAYANEVPFIAFRSLSDLAGGGAGANEMETFMSLAADNSAALVRAFLAEL